MSAGELVRSEHSGDFLRLTQLWRNRTHFSLLFAAVDNPSYRDGLIERLNAVHSGQRIDLLAADSPEDWLAHLQAATQAGQHRVHTVISQRHTESAHWWQRANVLRERLADAFPAPLLLWLSDTDIDTAAHHAPDLWNWREAVLTFTRPMPLALPTLSSERFSPFVGGTDAQQVRKRLTDILGYLQQTSVEPLAAAHLQLEAAQAYERLGELSASEAIARRAASAFQLSGNALLAAHAQAQIANILQARGQLDEALRIRQEEQMPVYERLGDVRSKAVTQGRIADILLARGQLDEALRIRQEEEMPVYERLGDVHSKAVTQGQIADILRARGQLDEALRIYQEEEMPVYEHLGDVRAKAVTQGKIADILQARGQLDEALRLHEERVATSEALGDSDGLAHARYSIAQLMFERGDHEKGGYQVIEDHLVAAFDISRRMGRTDFIAAIGSLLAQVLAMGSKIDEALDVLAQAEKAYTTLGDESGLRQVAELRERIEALREDG